MGTLKLNNVTAITESGGTVVLDSAVQDNITRLGTVTAGAIGSTVQVEDFAKDGWYCTIEAVTRYTSYAIIDFPGIQHLGSALTESAGVITIGTAGWYSVGCKVHNNNISTDWAELKTRKNSTYIPGAKIYWESDSEENTAYYENSNMVMVECAVNDTIDMYGQGWFYGDTGNNQHAMSAFWGWRIGK